KAYDVLRQRGAGDRRAPDDPGAHAQGGREGSRAREGRGARLRPRARRRDRPGRARDPHHADGPVQDRRGDSLGAPRPGVRLAGGLSGNGCSGAESARSGARFPGGPEFNRIRPSGEASGNGPPRGGTMKSTKGIPPGLGAAFLASGDLFAGVQCRLKGIVTDGAGAPIEGATIIVTTPGMTSLKLT